ncbi:MAG: DUF2793 domain-containing protein [Steroidobacteraceae bacterium]|nr:DUF2793 domain-containing protein [Steroidobacteraceae bacterium]
MTTPNLDLETVPSNSLQPSVPVNDSLQVLDALILPGGIVQDKDVAIPPTTVAGDAGKMWIIASGASGVWAGKVGQLALSTGATTWRYFVPAEGWVVYVLDEDAEYRYTGAAWTLAVGFTGGSLTSALNEAKGADIASAATTDIGAATGNFVHVTGTTTITALGTAQAGTRRVVRFAGALTLTHNATSLILPTGANITTAANDCAVFVSEGSGNWRCTSYQKADGTALAGSGGGGGLTNWTEAVSTAAPNASVPVASFTATNAATNVDATLLPKGTGALAGQIADSTTTGGNKRGARAVDWQLQRSAAAQVASGANAVVAGGQRNTASDINATVSGGTTNTASSTNATVGGGTANTASGSASSVGGGGSNTASGVNSTIAGGNNNSASAERATVGGGGENTANGGYSCVPGGRHGTVRGIFGARAFASGGNTGIYQERQLVSRARTTNATVTRLTSDAAAAGTTNQLVLPSSSAFAFRGQVLARNESTGDASRWDVFGLAKNVGGTCSMVGTPTVTMTHQDAGLAALVVAVSADNTNKAIAIDVTGIAATNIKWVASIQTVETEL